tara:strand:- start:355 stop:819 length:465 start_codon:yes stop_codon:yes gene_type:complete
MGVAGCGKTTIGSLLSKKTGSYFIEGDNFHSKNNIKKMTSGMPLNDSDRMGWLKSIKNETSKRLIQNNVIIACSALKQIYRKKLQVDNSTLIYLKISKNDAQNRLSERKDHFMPSSLVESQFKILEEPSSALIYDATTNIDDIVKDICKKINLK